MTEASHYARHPGPPPLRFRYAAFGPWDGHRTLHLWLWKGSELLASGAIAWLNPDERYVVVDGVAQKTLGETVKGPWSLDRLCQAAGVTYDEILLEPGNAETIAAARAFFEGTGEAL